MSACLCYCYLFTVLLVVLVGLLCLFGLLCFDVLFILWVCALLLFVCGDDFLLISCVVGCFCLWLVAAVVCRFGLVLCL